MAATPGGLPSLYTQSQSGCRNGFGDHAHQPIHRTIDVDLIERRHRDRVKSCMQLFEKQEQRETRAYIKMWSHLKPLKIKDRGKRGRETPPIEAIREDRENHAPGCRRPALPQEDPRKWRKQHRPVYFWG